MFYNLSCFLYRLNLSKEVILQWFSKIRTYFADKELNHVLQDPTRIFNIDESGFPLAKKNKSVLAKRGIKNCFEVNLVFYLK